MWLLKVFAQGRERRIGMHGAIARTMAQVLGELGYSVSVTMVTEHYDPVKSRHFVIDPDTQEVLYLPKTAVDELNMKGFVELGGERDDISTSGSAH